MKYCKITLCLLLLSFVSQFGWSQTPLIRGRNMKTVEEPVRVSDVHVDVQLIGPLAKTTVSISIYNPNSRVLEGEFNFPLADGQSISRFALDINGSMREGVAVDKAKAQEFFESIVRRQVDPGLIEKTAGNNFRSRVYPIPAHGSRKILIEYEQELLQNGENYMYTLPFYYGEGIDLSINMEALGYSIKPKIEQSLSRKLKFKKQDDKFVAQYYQKKQKNAKSVVISIPVDKTIASLTQKDAKTNKKTFYSRMFPNLNNVAETLPQKIAIYWDTSLSMESKDVKKEIELLDKYFKQIKNAQIELYIFNILQSKKLAFDIKDGNWKELKKALLAIRYDGATYVGNLDLANIDADAVLLFSDGISNWGKGNIEYKSIPIFTINSIDKADHSTLKYISIASGGKYLNLVNQDVDKAANSMVEQNIRLISAEYDNDEISDLAFLQYITNAGMGFSITGHIKIPSAKIKLNFGVGHQIIESKIVEISESGVLEVSNILDRIWAEKRIADLEIIYDVNKKEIEALGREYGIVTQNTSLIVLEELRDYVEFRITPPKELLDKYNESVARLDSKTQESKNFRIEIEKTNRSNEIEKSVDLLNKKREWWIKEFPKIAPFISIHDVIGTDDRYGIDIADLQEDRIVIERDSEPFLLASKDDFIPESVEEQKKDTSISKSPTIELKRWNPDVAYMKILNAASDDKLYDIYHSIRGEYKNMPSFYIDVSILLQDRGLKNEALLVISNLAEIELENYRLLRVLAHRLLHTNHTSHAIYQFEVVKHLRPEEPQTFRDLAFAYEQHGDYQQALDNYIYVIETPFNRFDDIKLYVVEEMNHLLMRAQKENITLDASRIDSRLLDNMPVDIRVMMSWDSDNTDIDLWVTDPYNQECYYGHKETYNGGIYFSDFTAGYGPESYQIREATKGKYKIVAKYFGNHSQSITGPTTIYLDIFTKYATENEKKETIMVRLDNTKDELVIGEIGY